MTLSDFLRDVQMFLAPKRPPPVYPIVRPVPVIVRTTPMPASMQAVQLVDRGFATGSATHVPSHNPDTSPEPRMTGPVPSSGIVTSSEHAKSRDSGALVGGK